MTFDLLRIYLLAGLVAHKAVWEVLKSVNRKQPARQASPSPWLTAVKGLKVAILVAILLQTLAPEILPIAADPQPLRFTGGFLFSAGLLLAVAARIQLGRQWSDIEIGSVAPDHKVIDRGIYGLIRHPIYTGDLLLLTGLELALNSWLVLGVAALAAAVFWKAGKEEQKLAAQLPGYREYQARTKRFVPYVV